VLQDFKQIEIIVSNNGADPALREVVHAFNNKHKLLYVEQTNALSMPEHWESISQHVRGKYLLILTDRSLLHQHALHHLHAKITTLATTPEVISWPWDLYIDHLHVLNSHPDTAGLLEKKDPIQVLLATINAPDQLYSLLPRGLNCCIYTPFLKHLRQQFGTVFRPITPDFTFAALCLLNSDQFYYLNQALFVSQGMKVSNGGNAYGGDGRTYLNTMKLSQPFKYTPLQLPLVQNMIHDDFLQCVHLCQRPDVLAQWSRSNYFHVCALEIEEKRKTAILDHPTIDEMEKAWLTALHLEATTIQDAVRIKQHPFRHVFLRMIGLMKSFLTEHMPWLYQRLLLRQPYHRTCATALEAAGFDVDEQL